MINLIEKVMVKGVFIYVSAVSLVRTTIEENGSPNFGMIILLFISSFVFAYGLYSLRKDLLNYVRNHNGKL